MPTTPAGSTPWTGFPIRPAVPADASALARLRYEFRAGIATATEEEEAFTARCTAWMTARLQPSSPWRCWVAEAHDALVAMIWLQLIERLPNPIDEREWHAYVTSFYVQPSARESGLGTALLTACLAECDRQGADAVFLWPTPRSRSLYARHGFAVRDDLMERRNASA